MVHSRNLAAECDVATKQPDAVLRWDNCGGYTQTVRTIYPKLVRKENWRRIFAAAFLLFLLVEFGSHTMTHAFSPSAKNHPAVSANEGCHEDPCQSLILCSDSRRERQQLPSPGHQTGQAADLVSFYQSDDPVLDLRESPPIPFGPSHAISRPTSPPFTPPELP